MKIEKEKQLANIELFLCYFFLALETIYIHSIL